LTKKPGATRTSPFELTKRQRDQLLLEWKRPSAHENARLFIAEVEQEMERWITFKHNETMSSAGVQRDAANKIQKAAAKLQTAINDIPFDVLEAVDCMLRDRTNRTHVYPQHRNAAEYMRAATGKERVNLYQMTEILNSWLPLLEEAAGSVAELSRRPGENKGHEKQFVFTLSQIYKKHFKKSPSYANNSTFRKFLSGLTQITGYDFGRIIAKEILKESKMLK
jgi:hypothetical protein